MRNKTRLQPFEDYGDVFILSEWRDSVTSHAITPWDGSGYWACAKGYSRNHSCFDRKPRWADRVIWYNK